MAQTPTEALESLCASSSSSWNHLRNSRAPAGESEEAQGKVGDPTLSAAGVCHGVRPTGSVR
eukprot:768673-Hanusia_phi.AAC.5